MEERSRYRRLSLAIGLAIAMAPLAATLGPLIFVLQTSETHLAVLPNDAHSGGTELNAPHHKPRSAEPLRDLTPLTTGPLLDLGTLPYNVASVAQAINEAGQVVGSSTADAPWTHGFLWDNGTMTDLGSLGGRHDYSWAYDINDTGRIVGTSYKTDLVTDGMVAFLWENGTMRDLAPGLWPSWAYAIDDAGHVVGAFSPNDIYIRHAFLWQNGVTTDLGTLGGQYSWAYDVNPAGQVVGWSTNASGVHRGFLWENGTMTDLGTLGGTSSYATAINNAGQVVGWSANASGVNHAFLWENGSMTDLGTLGGNSSVASGVNDAGLIVGTSQTSNSSHGFLWVNGLMMDLGTLGGSSSAAYGINDAGQVVGESQLSTGLHHAFLWPPPLTPYHNVGVTGDGDPLDVDVGTPVTIHVTAHNEGNRNETFNVTTYAGSILIGTGTVTDLPAFESESWSYAWNTTNITPNRSGYALRFEASPVANETYLEDNNYTGPTVIIRYAAQVTATPPVTDVGLPISFTCSSVDLPPTNLLYFSWEFGDGVIRSGANLTHVYNSPGTFTASCLVTNQDGVTAKGQTVVEISPTFHVTATVDRPQADPGVELTFFATTTGGSGGLAFDWVFGDGLSDQGANVSHAYASVGKYTATVTARDSAGGTTSNSITVMVSNVFVITPASRATTSPGKSMTFSARAAGGSGSFEYRWSFGDGSFASGATVTHAYAFSGLYVVTVWVTDTLGASASTSVMVIVSWHSGATSSTMASGATQETVIFPARGSGSRP